MFDVDGEALADEVVCVRRCDLVRGDWWCLLCTPGERSGEAGAEALRLEFPFVTARCCCC